MALVLVGVNAAEEDRVLVGFNEINVSSDEEPGDMEPGLADLDDPVRCGGSRRSRLVAVGFVVVAGRPSVLATRRASG